MHSSLWQFLESRLRASQDSSGKLVEDEDANAFPIDPVPPDIVSWRRWKLCSIL